MGGEFLQFAASVNCAKEREKKAEKPPAAGFGYFAERNRKHFV